MITLTDKSAVKVQEFLASQAVAAETAGLRVGVRGGGCSGFQYALAFDEQRDGDTIFAAATGAVDVPPDLVGVLAASVVADAIVRGVRAAARARES